MDIPSTEELVMAAEACCERHGIAESRFGRDATGEPQLLESLRRGRSPSLVTARKIADYIRAKDEAAGIAPQEQAA